MVSIEKGGDCVEAKEFRKDVLEFIRSDFGFLAIVVRSRDGGSEIYTEKSSEEERATFKEILGDVLRENPEVEFGTWDHLKESCEGLPDDCLTVRPGRQNGGFGVSQISIRLASRRVSELIHRRPMEQVRTLAHQSEGSACGTIAALLRNKGSL